MGRGILSTTYRTINCPIFILREEAASYINSSVFPRKFHHFGRFPKKLYDNKTAITAARSRTKKTMLPPSVCSESKHFPCPFPSRSKNAKLSSPIGNSPSKNTPAAMIGNRKIPPKRGSSDTKSPPILRLPIRLLYHTRIRLSIEKRTNVYIFFTNNADKRREKTPASSFNG